MAKPTFSLEMNVREFKELADYLERHESDIGAEINDFGDLKSLFILVFDLDPRDLRDDEF